MSEKFLPKEFIDERFIEGIHLFNAQKFFESHEILESLWKDLNKQSKYEEAKLCQGIIQIAVAYYHVSRNNKTGALKLFKMGLEKFERLEKKLLSKINLNLNFSNFIRSIHNDISRLDSENIKTDEIIPPVLTFL